MKASRMNVMDCARIITNETLSLLEKADLGNLTHLFEAMDQGARIFCGAAGRSGYVMQCFAMRLMHLGYPAYFAGDTTTPPIGRKDMLIVLSGSGETPWTCALAKRAKEAGATVCGVVGVLDSPIAGLTDYRVYLPADSKTKPLCEPFRSRQPAGSLFEQAAFLLLESVVLSLYSSQGSQAGALLARHANLE